MKNLFTRLMIPAIAIIMSQSFCNNDMGTKAPEQDKFVGAWASDAGGRGMSIYIEKSGEIYNCYFITQEGNYKNYKGIIENKDIKIGRNFTIKFLNDNKEIYLVEEARQFKKMMSMSRLRVFDLV